MPDNQVNPEGTEQTQQQQNQPKNALHDKAQGDWDKANASYFNAVNELGKTHEAVKQYQERVTQLEAIVQAALGGQQANPDPFQEFDSLGINSRAIEEAISQRINGGVEKKLSELLGPVLSQVQADEQLADEIPDFDQHKSAARTFMKQNPEVSAVFKALVKEHPLEAWKYAIRETVIAKQAEGKPRDLPTNSGGGGGRTTTERTTQNEADSAEAEATGLKYFHEYGDATHYRAARFKGTSVEAAVKEALRQAGLTDV